MKYFLFVLCLLLPASIFAATLRVNNTAGTSPNYATIQAAISAAADGDTILIEGSTTAYAPFDLINKRLTLVGPGYSLASNLGTPANKLGAIVSGGSSYIRTQAESAGSANGTLVMGLEFQGALYLEACNNVTIARCQFFSSNNIVYLHVQGSDNIIRQCNFRAGYRINFGHPTIVPSGNRIENCLMPDVELMMAGGITPPIYYLRNNLLRRISGDASVVAENNILINEMSDAFPNGTFRNNLFYNRIPDFLNGSGNITFTSASTIMGNFNYPSLNDNRYLLSPLSAANPAYNAGTDGTHIGPFGGANPYVLSGVPPLPTIDELSVPQFAAPGTNLTIRIKVSERP